MVKETTGPTEAEIREFLLDRHHLLHADGAEPPGDSFKVGDPIVPRNTPLPYYVEAREAGTPLDFRRATEEEIRTLPLRAYAPANRRAFDRLRASTPRRTEAPTPAPKSDEDRYRAELLRRLALVRAEGRFGQGARPGDPVVFFGPPDRVGTAIYFSGRHPTESQVRRMPIFGNDTRHWLCRDLSNVPDYQGCPAPGHPRTRTELRAWWDAFLADPDGADWDLAREMADDWRRDPHAAYFDGPDDLAALVVDDWNKAANLACKEPRWPRGFHCAVAGHMCSDRAEMLAATLACREAWLRSRGELPPLVPAEDPSGVAAESDAPNFVLSNADRSNADGITVRWIGVSDIHPNARGAASDDPKPSKEKTTMLKKIVSTAFALPIVLGGTLFGASHLLTWWHAPTAAERVLVTLAADGVENAVEIAAQVEGRDARLLASLLEAGVGADEALTTVRGFRSGTTGTTLDPALVEAVAAALAEATK